MNLLLLLSLFQKIFCLLRKVFTHLVNYFSDCISDEKVKAEKLYQFTEDAEHMVVLIVNKKSNNNQLTFNILNFNLDYYDSESLKIETVDITPLQSLLLVKSFRDEADAALYMERIRSDEKVLRDYDNPALDIVTISSENLRILLEDKLPDRYLKFYRKHYK